MSSQSFTQKPTLALQSSELQTRAWAEKQQLIGQLSLQTQQTQPNATEFNGNANTMNAAMPHTTAPAMQDALAFCAAVEAPQAAVAPVAAVAGVEIAEPCMPEGPVLGQPEQTMVQDLLWHTQELFCGTDVNIALLPCLGLCGDDIDFPGTPEPGGET